MSPLQQHPQHGRPQVHGVDAAVRQATQRALGQLQAVEQLVVDVVDAAFGPGRTPRSCEYRAGVRALLLKRTLCRPLVCPFEAGSGAADAWHAGVDAGVDLWSSEVHALHTAFLHRDATAGKGQQP